MAEPLGRRFRRFAHSLREESAPRIARFLLRDRRERAGVEIGASEEPVAGGYFEDAPELDRSTPDAFPPVIFQTWKSKSVIPANYRYWRQSFVENNPAAKVVLWDDEDNRAFVAERYPWALECYDSYPREIFRADAVRFFFLLEFGGMYADMDTECLRPVLPSASAGGVVLCRMGGDIAFDHSIPNAVMASRPGQLFWLFVIKRMIEAAEHISDDGARRAAGPEQMTGPVMLKTSYDAFISLDEAAIRTRVAPLVEKLSERQRGRLRYEAPTLLPSAAWYPLDWTNLFHKQLCNRLREDKRILPPEVSAALFPRSAVVTFWSHSW